MDRHPNLIASFWNHPDTPKYVWDDNSYITYSDVPGPHPFPTLCIDWWQTPLQYDESNPPPRPSEIAEGQGWITPCGDWVAYANLAEESPEHHVYVAHWADYPTEEDLLNPEWELMATWRLYDSFLYVPTSLSENGYYKFKVNLVCEGSEIEPELVVSDLLGIHHASDPCAGIDPPVSRFYYTTISNNVTVNTGTSTDPDGSDWTMTRLIDWGDGQTTSLPGGTQVAATHNYETAGTYTITVTVTNSCDLSDSSEDEVTIEGVVVWPPDPPDPEDPEEPDNPDEPVDPPVEDGYGLSCPAPALDSYTQPCGLDVTDEMKAHLAETPTTLCVCWRIERRDGVIFGFTSHVRDLVIDTGRGGEMYKSSSGMTPSGFANSENLTVDNMEVQAFFDDDAITERDLTAGLFDDAGVEIFIVNYDDLSMGRIMGPRGFLGKVSRRNNNFVAEHRSLSQKLNQNILPTTSELCRVKKLGDYQCKVDLSGMTEDGYKITANGYVVASENPGEFTSNFSATATPPYMASTEYVWDTVEFTSGKNKDEEFSLVSFDGSKAVVFYDDYNEVKSIKKGDEGVIHATRISDSGEVDFSFEVADALNNGNEHSFNVKGSFWGDTPPAGEDSYPEGHFTFGTVKFMTGENHGIEREVKGFGPSGFTLFEAFPFIISPNDHFIAVAGCDRRKESCRGKYNNVINFHGEPEIPGIELLMSVNKGNE